jgi:hypothetical protein
MRFFYFYSLILAGWLAGPAVRAQTGWPREIPLPSGGRITIYLPQPERLTGNKLKARAAVAVRRKAGEEPVFGAVFVEATLATDKDRRRALLEKVLVQNARFADVGEDEIDQLKALLEREIPKWELELSLDQLLTTLERNGGSAPDDFRHEPPTIIYRDQPSTLVQLDGDPVVKPDPDLKMERVMNTPYLIVKDGAAYYLYGGRYWYSSPQVLEGWQPLSRLPARIKQLDDQLKKQEREQPANGSGAPDAPQGPTAILVRTRPTELIQTAGEAQYATIEGTQLLYLSNTVNDVFRDIGTQKLYVLLSGRWYEAASLQGPWRYVAADGLPADFARIPEGSEKDGVLAHVAGTAAAEEAVLDAQIPQTARVDRKTATVTVRYDGEPQFEAIPDTDLERATNTASTVLRVGGGRRYYCVENGVWFEAGSPNGPWIVGTERPGQVDRIPPSDPVYNVRYVYIYDTTPQYVYVGYTPGYMGCYVAGPTIIYGTGYVYRPWYGVVYYPRPVTWGYGMCYNPWTGFSMTIGFGGGFFFYSNRYYGGWFGPPVYRPPYRPYYGGYYGARPVYRGRPVNTRPATRPTHNLYARQRGAFTRDNRPRQPTEPNRRPGGSSGVPGRSPGATRPSTGGRPTPSLPTRPRPAGPARPLPERSRPAPNDLLTDRTGTVFQRGKEGELLQRERGTWRPVEGSAPGAADARRAAQARDRALQRQGHFESQRQAPPTGTRPGGTPPRGPSRR